MKKLVAVGAATAVAAGALAIPALAATKTVQVKDNKFVAGSITVSKGTTVKWVWTGKAPHNVKASKTAVLRPARMGVPRLIMDRRYRVIERATIRKSRSRSRLATVRRGRRDAEPGGQVIKEMNQEELQTPKHELPAAAQPP